MGPRGSQRETKRRLKGDQRDAKGSPRDAYGRPLTATAKTEPLTQLDFGLPLDRGGVFAGSSGVRGGFTVRGKGGGGVHPSIRMGPPRGPGTGGSDGAVASV